MSTAYKGKRYTMDFKQQIFELHQNGIGVTKLSREYGVPVGTIYKWLTELKPIGISPEGKPINKKEVDALRKRIRELEMENEILKKATAIFAKRD